MMPKTIAFTCLLATTMLGMPGTASAEGPPYTSSRASVTRSLDLLGGEASGDAQADAGAGSFFLYARTSSDSPLSLNLWPVSLGANSVTSVGEFMKVTTNASGAIPAGAHPVRAELSLSRLSTIIRGSSTASVYVSLVSYATYCNPGCTTTASPFTMEYLACTWSSSYCTPKTSLVVGTQVSCPATCTSLTTYVTIVASAASQGLDAYAEAIGDGTVLRIDH